MFARMIDFVSKPGKTRTLNETIQSRLFPILRVQPGFVDEIVLESDIEPNHVVSVSFWRTREQAERYNRETYPAVKAVLVGSLETDPVVRTFKVASSTTCNIHDGEAAQGGQTSPLHRSITSVDASQPDRGSLHITVKLPTANESRRNDVR